MFRYLTAWDTGGQISFTTFRSFELETKDSYSLFQLISQL